MRTHAREKMRKFGSFSVYLKIETTEVLFIVFRSF